MDHKRIFLFTNDDNPLKGDADETKKVHMIAQVCVLRAVYYVRWGLRGSYFSRAHTCTVLYGCADA